MAAALPTTIQPIVANTDKTYKARMIEADLGGGYRTRAADGINPIERSVSLEWIGNETNIEELITHFEEREGYQSFTWTPPNETESLKWTCKEWSVAYDSTTVMRLSATLRKENDLA